MLETDQFDSELTLQNEGAAALSGDWSLYFNSASKLELSGEKADFDLSHINGDFYVLRPKAGTKPFAPGDHRRIALRGSPWAINVSDAPSGFYILPGEQGKATGPIAVSIRVEPFPSASKLRRGADDRVPVVTAEARYWENEALTTIPPDQLIKVVPTPGEITPGSGRFLLKSSMTIFYEPGLSSEAHLLAEQLSELLCARLVISEGIRATYRLASSNSG